MLSLKNPSDIVQEVAHVLRSRRLSLGWRQTDLAARSGVANPTLRRFERTGKISFEGLAKLVASLGLTENFLSSMKLRETSVSSIAAFLAVPTQAKRIRAPRQKYSA